MLLKYEVGVIGAQNVARALSGIESRFAQHARKLNALTGSSGRAASPAAAASAARREAQQADREQQRQLNYWRNAHVQSQRARMREEDKRHRVAMRNSEKEARAAQRAATQAIRARQRFIGGAFGKMGDSVRGSIGAVGRLGAAATGLAGGFAVAGAIQERMRDTRLASQLANQAGNPALKGQLLRESRGVKGFTSDQVLGGIGEFVTKTGDLDTGRKLTGSVSQLSLATGADFGDLMATAGQAFNVLKDQISDPVQLLDELNGVLGALAQQGALGAVEIKDLAQDFGKLGAATRGFEGGAPDLLRTMGAFAQIAVARGGAESSADASTAASRLVNDMTMPANRRRFDAILGAGGLKSKTDPTKLRDPLAIMLDVLDKTGGDVMKTSGLFGAESGKIFKGLSATYSAAEKKQKGSGRKAVEDEFQRFAGAKLDGKDVTARANSRLEDPDLRLQEAMKELNAGIADKLLPTVMRLVPEFEKLIPFVEHGAKRFAQLAEAFAQDPIGGIAKLIAAKLAFDVAASTVAESGKKLANSLTGAANGVSAATGGGASGGIGSAAMLGAQLGITAASVILTANVVNFEKGEADALASGKELNELRAMAEKAKSGMLAPEEARKARDLQMSIDKRAAGAKAPGLGEQILSGGLTAAKFAGPVGWAFGGISKLMGTDSDKQASAILNGDKANQVNTQESFSKEATELRKSIEGLTAAVKAQPVAVGGAGPNRGNSPSPIKG